MDKETQFGAWFGITNNAKIVRGIVINAFTVIEVIMDDLIRKLTFGSEEEYDKYMSVLQRKNLSMPIKQELFNMCLEKYEVQNKVDLSAIKNRLEPVIKKRNVMAHWTVDTTQSALKLFLENDQIRFQKFFENENRFEYETMTEVMANDLEKTMKELEIELAKIQATFYQEGTNYGHVNTSNIDDSNKP